jgi:uncharacterized protein YeaC (DUF1315 family)
MTTKPDRGTGLARLGTIVNEGQWDSTDSLKTPQKESCLQGEEEG